MGKGHVPKALKASNQVQNNTLNMHDRRREGPILISLPYYTSHCFIVLSMSISSSSPSVSADADESEARDMGQPSFEGE